ncbi:uncharacterized protein JCM15063_001176 [Sporobolomyces koalae]|uniref:uncharacterized protein n=1 Tax=Sporobolomyces koalae TaxID=500713 RepID=UPI003175474E
MTTIQRRLGDYERYSLARHNIGHAPGVIFTALVSSVANVERAIESLLTREPLLSSSVHGARTTEPRYEQHEHIRPDQVWIARNQLAPSPEQVLLDGIRDMTDMDISIAPLWRVYTYQKDPESGLTRVAVAAHHVIGDGSATRNLFSEFLTLLRDPAAETLSSAAPVSFPPSLDESIDVRPSKWYLLRTFTSMLVAPRLPAFLYPASVSPWPSPALASPIDKPTGLRIFFLPADLSLALAKTPKTHGVPTLHPVLIAAAFAAVALVASRTPSSTTLNIVAQSPVSIRAPELGHPVLTGNYVSSIPHSTTAITPQYLSSTGFWSYCRTFAEYVRRPAVHQEAKEGMGMLAYLPPGMATPDSQNRPRTAWEKYLQDRMLTNPNPWQGGSFEVSNVGRMKDSQTRTSSSESEEFTVRDVCWAQPGSGMGVGMGFNAVSHGGVLAVTLTWRQDAIATTQVDAIFQNFRSILTKVAKGDVSDDTNFADLTFS